MAIALTPAGIQALCTLQKYCQQVVDLPVFKNHLVKDTQAYTSLVFFSKVEPDLWGPFNVPYMIKLYSFVMDSTYATRKHFGKVIVKAAKVLDPDVIVPEVQEDSKQVEDTKPETEEDTNDQED